ncbi:GNAT family N-acetyltransferase [Streptomyces sp. NRRL F-5123]|uniref:GNAT family N-acetyltransferase n=1 Tax=Streptomyces sp. NRRL F-5123 TaxID=1463856 RepID=UPI0006936909|nr:GNAT family N-acetyltransferase [Streptomyces sp. NRRL F-5123]
MGWTFSHSPAAFLRAAEPFLLARPVENSVVLTVTDTLRRRGPSAYGQEPPVFGWWRPAGEPVEGPDASGAEPAAYPDPAQDLGPDGGVPAVQAAFLRTPPNPPLLTRAPVAAAAELAAALAAEPLAEVRGDHEAVTAFADAWSARSRAPYRVVERIRFHELGTLVPRVPGPPGHARIADAADRDLLIRWQTEADAEIGHGTPGRPTAADDAILHGLRTLWIGPGGEPVAMAGRTLEVAGSVRVVAVYTPPGQRGRGYAGGAVTAVTQAALDAGVHRVLLVTDLANPVSNGLYHRLGYRPVRDGLRVALGAGEAGRAQGAPGAGRDVSGEGRGVPGQDRHAPA